MQANSSQCSPGTAPRTFVWRLSKFLGLLCVTLSALLSTASMGQDPQGSQKKGKEEGKSKFSEDDLEKAELVRSVIAPDRTGIFSSSVHELLNPPMGSFKLFRVRLENSTGAEFAFAKTSKQCNCIRVEPEEGVIGAGESMEILVQSRVPMSESGATVVSELKFESESENSLSHSVRFTFKFDKLVGFPLSFIELPVVESQLNSPVRFEVPVVIGGDVPLADVDIILGACDTSDRPGFEFEIVNDRAVCRIDLSRTSLIKDGTRITSSLIIGRNSNDQLGSVPLIIEKTDQLKIFPRFVNFVQRQTGDWVGSVHVRKAEASVIVEDVKDWSVSAEVGSIAIGVKLEPLNSSIGKLSLTIPKGFDFSANDRNVGSRKLDVRLKVTAESKSFALRIIGMVPQSSKGLEK